jgi:CRISPR type III-A-associated protein Csm2
MDTNMEPEKDETLSPEAAGRPEPEGAAPAADAAPEARVEVKLEAASEPAETPVGDAGAPAADTAESPAPPVEPAGEAAAEAAPESAAAPAAAKAGAPPAAGESRRGERRERGEKPNREKSAGERGPKGDKERGERRGDKDRGERRGERGDRDRGRGDRDRRGYRDRRPDGPIEADYDKLLADSLYLDNLAHALVGRMRDLDAGTRSQLRRLYGSVRRATRAAESDRQHQFVMLRARLAYTIARHGLRSLDPLEKLLLAVTRRNESRGYSRFRDLFEAIIAYNE